jgi:transcriptional regulator with XRE-family HTH domain
MRDCPQHKSLIPFPAHEVYKGAGGDMSLGTRLQAARLAAGLTQRELAKACGWDSESQSRISQYENDRREPTVADIAKIAKITGADPGLLAFDKPLIARDEAALLQAYRTATPEGRGFIESAATASRDRRGVKRRGSG